MLDLPILNVRLSACPADWQQMTPTPQGRHCSSCNREVVDFTAATQTDLDAARAAAPDGRLCGRFRTEQVAVVQPQLRPKLRRFLVALVCGLGLTSGEVWAQSQPKPTSISPGSTGMIHPQLMPTYPGGIEELLLFIKKNQIWPDSLQHVEGKVFVEFLIDTVGDTHQPRVRKSLHPQLDAEAVRLVDLLHFEPGQHHRKPVAVRYTLPVPFQQTPPVPKRRRLFGK